MKQVPPTKTVSIAASHPYEVAIGCGILSTCGEEIRRRLPAKRAAVISDRTVAALYGDTVCRSLKEAGLETALYAFEPGETHKTLETVAGILDFCTANGLTRTDCIVALGGGIVGDVAGFSASVYLRGIPFVQLPTTFLAAIDASVGGKTGVNLPAGKNLAGAFWQPSFVLCDCAFFQTLPRETFLDGVSEAVKYGVIADEALFDSVRIGGAEKNPVDVVGKCVAIKSRFVAADEFDHGTRQMLNFGHTFGHAVETASGYAVTHGHAVAIGMAAAARAAVRLGLTDEACLHRICNALAACGLPTTTDLPLKTLAAGMRHDKKASGDQVTLVLPKRIGECVLYPVAANRLEELFQDAVTGEERP